MLSGLLNYQRRRAEQIAGGNRWIGVGGATIMDAMDHGPPTAADEEAAVLAYYARDQEHDRLADGTGRLEFLRTLEVVARTLPTPPATVADIGGGPGRYTDHLLGLGHRVVHRDLVDHHVDRVRGRHPTGSPAGDRLDAAVGDARDLDLADRSVDAALLLGPLYHLAERADRVQVLREAGRVVRPGGPVHAAAISRWAVRLDGIVVNRLDADDPQALAAAAEAERTGVLRPLFEGSFNGYLHTPDELRDEVAAAGLVLTDLVSVEGIGFALHDLDRRLADPLERDRLLTALRVTESAPELLGVGPHLLAVARVPD